MLIKTGINVFLKHISAQHFHYKSCFYNRHDDQLIKSAINQRYYDHCEVDYFPVTAHPQVLFLQRLQFYYKMTPHTFLFIYSYFYVAEHLWKELVPAFTLCYSCYKQPFSLLKTYSLSCCQETLYTSPWMSCSYRRDSVSAVTLI